MDFGLCQYAHGDHIVIALRGELDLSTVPALKTRLHSFLDGSVPRLILDLAGLTFMDSAGMAALVIADRRARQLGVGLVLAGPQQIVARVLSLTALDQHFPVYPTVAEAAADGGGVTGAAGPPGP